MAKEKTILSIEELQSLHDLVWSEDIENVMIGVSIIKGTEMTN